ALVARTAGLFAGEGSTSGGGASAAGRGAAPFPDAHGLSVVGHDLGADLGKIEEPLRVWDAQVDTSVAHRRSEIVVPVGAVETVASEKIHDVGHVTQIVVISTASPRHVGCSI